MTHDMHWVMTETGPFNLSAPDGLYPFYPYAKTTWYLDRETSLPTKRVWNNVSTSASVPPHASTTWRVSQFYNDGLPYKARHKVHMEIPDLKPDETPPLHILDYCRVVSKPHGMDTILPVLKMELHLDNPSENSINLGYSNENSFVAATSSINKELQEKLNEVPEISSVLQMAKDNASALIKAATNGYVTMHQTPAGYVDEIIISDEEDYEKAARVWRWNSNGLGYSNTGYDGEFGLAMTMDGAIVADRITAGTMYADRIKGGTLTLGGIDNKNGVMKLVNKDNDIVCVLDASGAYINGIIESKNPDNGNTLRLDNGSMISLQNGEKRCEINTTTVYEGRTKPGINLYSQDAIILKCDWLGVADNPDTVVWAVPKHKKIDVVTKVNLASDGTINSVEYQTLEFIHGIQINP